MEPQNYSRTQVKFGLRGWVAIGLAIAVLGVMTAAVVFLAVGLFVFTLPVLLLAPVIYYFAPKPKLKPMPAWTGKDMPNNSEIIEGEYRVIKRGGDDEVRQTEVDPSE
jgi:hypothetical protein